MVVVVVMMLLGAAAEVDPHHNKHPAPELLHQAPRRMGHMRATYAHLQ